MHTNAAVNRVSTEQVLNKAYRLAYFLHQDKAMAIRIVAAATLKLNVAMAVQSKRLYYVPVGRFSRGESRRTDAIRNKALFSDVHLLQRLVYVESEPYERQKERAAMAEPAGVDPTAAVAPKSAPARPSPRAKRTIHGSSSRTARSWHSGRSTSSRALAKASRRALSASG